jgi:hypothetical protein
MFSRHFLVGCLLRRLQFASQHGVHIPQYLIQFVLPNTFCRDLFPWKSHLCLILVTKAPTFYLYNVGSFEQARVCLRAVCDGNVDMN